VAPAVGENVRKIDWRKRAKVRHAALHNAARMIQNILLDGAMGRSDAYGPGMRVLEFTANVMAPAKDEQKGYGSSPLMSRIVSDDADPPAPPPAEPTGREPAVIDKDGVPYVEAD